MGKWEFGAFLLGILGCDCVIKHGNEHLEYDEEKQKVEQQIPPEHEENLIFKMYFRDSNFRE